MSMKGENGTVNNKFAGFGPLGDTSNDWPCEEAGCGNRNFAKRMKCHKCGVPRPEHTIPDWLKRKVNNNNRGGPWMT